MKIRIDSESKYLINEGSGEVIANTSPKFTHYTSREHYEKDRELDYIDCQCAKELDRDKLDKYILERITVAEQKFDGHRGKLHITSQGNRLFSRNVAKIGWHSENSDQVPHIRDASIDPYFYDTIIDGEILLPVEDCDCRDVQGVTGALPARAIQKQLEVGFAYLNAFDIIKYNGLDVTSMPYWKRKILLFHVVKAFNLPFIKFCDIYTVDHSYLSLISYYAKLDKSLYTGALYKSFYEEFNRHIKLLSGSYDDLFSEFLQKGFEGLILKDVNCKYEQKKCDNFVKMKSHLTFDCVIMGYDEPTMEYTGSELGTWKYWQDDKGIIYKDGKPQGISDDELIPITKFFAEGWIGAIRFGVWKEVQLQYFINTYGEAWEKELNHLKGRGLARENGKHHLMLVEVGKTSGMDEETRERISLHKHDYLGDVIEVEAQKIIDKETGSLQHPRFYRLRPDKNSFDCSFDDHIRK